MASTSRRIRRHISQAEGSVFIVSKDVVSSGISTTAVALTGAVSGGDVLVEKVVLSTDSTGLAGATNFIIRVSGEVYGLNDPIEEAVSNLGASAHRVAPSAGAADTTNDNGITVTAAVPFLLQAGDSLQYVGTGSAGTGAGIVRVVLVCRRLAQGAKMRAA